MMGYKGWRIPEGNTVQVTDASGVVMWKLETSKPIILEVEKITSDTYAGETTYTGEQFVLLDIYPKSNGTVNITYGGLTKTITDTSGAENPNAQQVFFGTFNGVSDSVVTPASGTLTIEGDCYAFVCSEYKKTAKSSVPSYCFCVTAIKSFGKIDKIPNSAFGTSFGAGCKKITDVRITSNIKSIGDDAFAGCSSLENVELCEGVEQIGTDAFGNTIGNAATPKLKSLEIPASVSKIMGALCGVIGDNIIKVNSKNTEYRIDGNCLIEIKTGALLQGFGNSVIPDYVTRIGSYSTTKGGTFSGQTGLTSITIPASVQSIGAGAFSSCSGLTEIIVLATTPPVLSNAASVGGTSLTCPIIVPAGCGATYKAAEYWSEVADRIVEVS